jgi:hypothetical protein
MEKWQTTGCPWLRILLLTTDQGPVRQRVHTLPSLLYVGKWEVLHNEKFRYFIALPVVAVQSYPVYVIFKSCGSQTFQFRKPLGVTVLSAEHSKKLTFVPPFKTLKILTK